MTQSEALESIIEHGGCAEVNCSDCPFQTAEGCDLDGMKKLGTVEQFSAAEMSTVRQFNEGKQRKNFKVPA